MVGIGLAQNGVQRGDDGDAQVAQQGEDEAARRAAVNSVLVLEADDVRVAEVEVIGGAAVGIEIALAKFKAHFGRIIDSPAADR